MCVVLHVASRVSCYLMYAGIAIALCSAVRPAGAEDVSRDDSGVVYTADETWVPLVLDWRDTATAEWDFSPYIHKPAGKHGFVRVKGDRFVIGEPARRIRFWGCNLSAYAAAPTKKQAEILARRLVKLGFNAVRFTHTATLWNKSAFIDWGESDRLVFNEEVLDRFFHLVAELKKHGIYIMLDGVHHFYFHLREHAPLSAARAGGKNFRDKGIPFLYFVDTLQQHHKAYLRKLFLTKNPYTGLALADDPALMGVTMINEACLAQRAKGFRLKNVPEAYKNQFTDLWNQWVSEQHQDDKPLAEFDESFATRIEFWRWLQLRFMKDFKRYYQNQLRIKCPIATTNGFVFSSDWASPALSDYAEGHGYFAHRRREKISGDEENLVWAFPTNYSWLSYLLSQRIGYMPYVVGEWNGCYPSPQRYHAPLAFVTLAQRQGWDGSFIFTFNQRRWETTMDAPSHHFSMHRDPSILANMIPAALAWHGGLLPQAEISYSVKSDPSLLTRNSTERGVIGEVPFKFRLFNTPPVEGIPAPPDDMLTIELTGDFPSEKLHRAYLDTPVKTHWAEQELFLVRGDKMEIISGKVGGKTLRARRLGLSAPDGQEYSVSLVPLDEKSIGESQRMLLTLGPVSLARGAKIASFPGKNLQYEITSRLKNPVVKPSAGQVTIRHPEALEGHILDANGRKSEPLDMTYSDGVNSFRIQPDDQALWYLLSVKSQNR